MANSDNKNEKTAEKETTTAAKNQTDAAGPPAKTAKKRTRNRLNNIDPVRQPAAAALNISEDSIEDGRVTRWVRNDPMRISQLEQIGYEVYKDEDGDKVVVRDLIRMSIPVDQYAERVQSKNARGRELARAGANRFRDAARGANVQVEDTSTTRAGTEADAD